MWSTKQVLLNCRSTMKLYQYSSTSYPYFLRTMSSFSKEFTEAQDNVKKLTEDPGNESKLKMYALYKQATVGQVNIKKPGMLDLVGKAKWEAWKELGNMSQDVAQNKYIEHVSKLVYASKHNDSTTSTTSVGGSPSVPGLTITTEDRLRIIKFNRPNKKNALSMEIFEGMVTVLQDAAKDDTVAITVITGVGDYFSSGNDLSNITKLHIDLENHEELKQMSKDASSTIESFVGAFIDFPKPIVAVVNGPAVGIAVTILGLCDAVYASDRATFHTPFSALGLCAEGCSTHTFPKIMGHSNAMEILTFNKKITANEGHRLNLVTEVFADANLQEIWPRLKELAQLPVLSMTYSKQLTRQFEKELLHKVNAAEFEKITELKLTDDCRKAVQKRVSKIANK